MTHTVDPIEGGVDNDYTWPTDPIGKNDLSGLLSADAAEKWAAKGHLVLSLDVVLLAVAGRTYFRSAIVNGNKLSVGFEWLGAKLGWRMSIDPAKARLVGGGGRNGPRLPAFSSIAGSISRSLVLPQLQQQWDCHVMGASFEYVGGNGTWDLETGRADNPEWGFGIYSRGFGVTGSLGYKRITQFEPSMACSWGP